MTDQFASPATPEGIDYKTINGSLLLVTVKGLEEKVKTSLGEKDAVRADIVVLDGATKGATFTDALIFPRVLISQTRSQIGKMVLGRLTQGNAKPGQNPPWKLDDATEADKETARRYLAYVQGSAIAQPSAPVQQQPTPQPAAAAAAPATPW